MNFAREHFRMKLVSCMKFCGQAKLAKSTGFGPVIGVKTTAAVCKETLQIVNLFTVRKLWARQR